MKPSVDRIGSFLKRPDALVRASFRFLASLEDPENYRGGSESLVLIMVGLASLGYALYLNIMKQVSGPLLAMAGMFPQVAIQLPLRVYMQLAILLICIASFSVFAEMGRRIAIGGMKSLKQGR